MRQHLSNFIYGVLDYASYPLGMLLVAPIVFRRLGASEYGLWMVATAIVSAGGIIASGFSDAATQQIARLRACGNAASIADVFRSMLAINLLLGSALALAVWIAAPAAARHIAVPGQLPVSECLLCVRLASILIFVRGVESAAVSTHRAFEQYRRTVQISASMRILTLAAAAILVLAGHRTGSLLAITGIFLVSGACLQLRTLRPLLGPVSFRPSFHAVQTKTLLQLGIFIWLQTVGSVIFGQFDRILLGVSLGALALAPYALCLQFAHPIFGLSASALHFLFPYFSGRASTSSSAQLRRSLLKALLCNFLIVAAGTAALLLVGDRLLLVWAGPQLARTAAWMLTPIVLGSALLGLSVTGTYAMQALGLFKTVALLSIGSRAAMLFAMIYLLHHMGPRGLVLARLGYGCIALLIYLPLASRLKDPRPQSIFISPLAVHSELKEEPQP